MEAEKNCGKGEKQEWPCKETTMWSLRQLKRKCFPWLALSQEQEPTRGGSCSRYISSGSALKISAKSFPEGQGDPDMKRCDAASFPDWNALNPA